MQLSRVEYSSQEAHNGQLGQPQAQDGWCSQDVVPEDSLGLLGVRKRCPMSPSRRLCVQVDNQCCRQPEIDLKAMQLVS